MPNILMACACAGFLSLANAALAQISDEKPIDFATQVQPIFDKSCAGSFCHAGTSPSQGQNLEAGKSYDNIVNIPSAEAPGVMRVKPFDTENSYLYRKLEGEQADLGGSGGRMPFGKPALAADQIKLIEDWINQGALKVPPPPVTAVEASAWGQVKRLAEGWVR